MNVLQKLHSNSLSFVFFLRMHLLIHVQCYLLRCLPLTNTLFSVQIISAAETLALHPSSKIAKENLEVFCEAWESQLSDMSMLLREINDVFEGRRGKNDTQK